MTARRGANEAIPNASNGRYKLRNWSNYNEPLKRRGDITLWFSQEAIEAWHTPHGGKQGGQLDHSDVAVLLP